MGFGRHTAALALAALVHVPFSAAAAETDTSEARIIRVVGVATASAAPDRAEIDLGVRTQAGNAEQAARQGSLGNNADVRRNI